MSTRSRFARCLSFCVLSAGLLTASQVLAALTLTGHVPVDFSDPGVVVLDDGSTGPDVGMPPVAAGVVSGWDMKGVRLFHDPASDVLYVGFETFGIAGDADGDGVEGGTSPWLASVFGVDLPQFAETESAAVMFDFDGDGLFDVIAGVPGDSALGDFTVAQFAGVPSAPAFAFGPVLADQAMGAYTSGPTSASSPHLEFAIPRFSELPGFAGSFRFQAFMGSFADAGIGDDRVPDGGSTLVCLDADQDGYTTCDGDCDDRQAQANPGALGDPFCDGIDDDCDGETDEDFGGLGIPTECGTATVCRAMGVLLCVNGETVDTCVPGDNGVFTPTATSCGAGACAATGSTTCATGDVTDTCTPGAPAASDPCNGIDDDCDGVTDEDFVPSATSCGVGLCQRDGVTQCVAGVLIDTCVAGPPAAETCDGEDEDCDGLTDEDAQLPPAPVCGQGGCASVGTIQCISGTLVETCEPGGSETEICDGIDNDCDGETDEDPKLAEPAACGQGACAAVGTVQCIDGEEVASCEPALPGAELCDGLDNDCDGLTDEDVALPAPPTCGVVACHAVGTVSCHDGQLVEVCHALRGTEEVCDLIDNDCDGQTDEDAELPPAPNCGVGSCAAIGTSKCLRGEVVTSCVPGRARPETCDGLDNDCDGRTDEDPALPAASGCGVGACAASGSVTCEAGEVVASCLPGTPGVESCNGVDDDCDGQTDEDVALPAAPTCGEGACAATGTVACVGGELVETCEAGSGRPEACNGVDDDCDGQTDEDVALPAAPTCGEGACAATGTVACAGGAIVESCEPGTAHHEDNGCDGVDDDCDGQTDEGFQGTPTECGVGACHGRGQTSCVGGEIVDSCIASEPAAGDATCDDVDDDCDGETDEDCALCGDGVVQDGEGCDDGNDTFFDGCTPTCDIEQCPLVLDFEVDAKGHPVQAGEDLSMAWIDAGISLEAYTKADMSVGTLPLAFNSAAPTGGDTDLGTPNGAFGGPGVGKGGKATNELARGMVAVIAENLVDANKDGLVDSPDDNAKGGAMVFEFDYPVCIDSVGILDNDCGETITLRAYSAQGMLLSTHKASALGDNSYESVGVDTCGVRRLVVTMTGSGSVTHLTYCPDTTEVCDGVDNDGDLEIDEDDACGCPVPDPGRSYIMSAAHSDECGGGDSTHAVYIPGFFDGKKEHVVRFTFNDDARFEWDGSGATARFYGTATVYSLGGGKGDMGSEWFVDVSLNYRGQGVYGQGYGGPKREMAGCQPEEVTDTWDYFGFAANKAHMWRVSNPLDSATLTMYPVDAQYPVQVGMGANGKNAGLGLSTWFSYKRNAPNAKCISGYGDFNVDLDCP